MAMKLSKISVQLMSVEIISTFPIYIYFSEQARNKYL